MRRTKLVAAALGGCAAALVGAGAAPADPALPPSPQMPFCTFLGAEGQDTAGAAAVGPDGSLWIVADSTSREMRGAVRTGKTDSFGDIVVLRLDPATHAVMSSAWIGGDGADYSTAIAVGKDGAVFVAGLAPTKGFPATEAWSSQDEPWRPHGFLARVRADGSGFEWAALLDSSVLEVGYALVVTPDGDPVLAGTRRRGTMVARYAADGSGLVYSTTVADTGYATALAVRPDGRLVVGGRTYGGNLPGAARLRPEGGYEEGFIAELDAEGTVVRSALLGGTFVDALAVSGDGLFVLGPTGNPSSPIDQQESADTPGGVLFLRLGPDWSITAQRPFGGSGDDRFLSMAAASDGKVWVCGETTSADLALLRPIQPMTTSGEDAFVGAFDAADLSPVFMSYLGGGSRDIGRCVAAGPSGAVWLLGTTGSTDLPFEDADQTVLGRPPLFVDLGTDLFVARFAAPTSERAPPAAFATLSAQALNGHAVRLRWSELPQGITEVVVLRREASGAFQRVAVVPATTADWIDATAAPARTYVYAVQAANEGGGSSAAPMDEVRTPGTLDFRLYSTIGTVVRARRERPEGGLRLRMKGRLAASLAPGASGIDPVADGIEWAITTGPGGVVGAFSIPAGDPAWRLTRRGLRWVGPEGRVEFDPASGVFDVRTRIAIRGRWPTERSGIRVSVGEESAALEVQWRRAGGPNRVRALVGR